jgi:hypothetical protein
MRHPLIKRYHQSQGLSGKKAFMALGFVLDLAVATAHGAQSIEDEVYKSYTVALFGPINTNITSIFRDVKHICHAAQTRSVDLQYRSSNLYPKRRPVYHVEFEVFNLQLYLDNVHVDFLIRCELSMKWA